MENKNYCVIYIVRHGETEWNVARKLQGHKDSPLTKIGQAQAKELGKHLQSVNFAAVFSSDLYRAQHTAEIILLEKELVVKTTEALRERNFGIYDGKTWDDLRDFLGMYEQLSNEKKFTSPLATGIETDAEIAARFSTFLREIAVAYLGKNILVVTHGGVMRSFLIQLGFGDYETLPAGSVKNTALVKVETDGVDFFLKETRGIQKKDEKYESS